MEGTTLREFREIVYGGLFGLGAAAIDIVMHARMYGQELVDEILHPGPGMAFYRVLYVAFGFLLGWVLWRRNRKERKFRLLLKRLCDTVDLFDGHATVVYAHAQSLLMQETSKPPENAKASIGKLYENMQRIRALTNSLSELAHS